MRRPSPLVLVFAVVLVLVVGCGGTSSSTSAVDPRGTPATVSPEDSTANPACDAGNWIPRSHEPAHYLACTSHDDCAKMILPGCCSETHVAIRRDHACGNDLGSTCEMECDRNIHVHPEHARSMRAACVANKCTLVR